MPSEGFCGFAGLGVSPNPLARASGLALRDVIPLNTNAVDFGRARGREGLNTNAGTERVSALIMSTAVADAARPLRDIWGLACVRCLFDVPPLALLLFVRKL